MSDSRDPPASSPTALTSEDARSRQVELVISNLLRFGVIVSLAIVVIGTVISFVHHHEYLSQPPALQRLTKSGAAFPRTLRDVHRDAKELRGQSIVVLGLLLLIATPVLRVAVSIVAFAVERDWRYVAITSLVLALLGLSFFLGAG